MFETSRRLLIVDDDESFRQTLARALSRKGFEVSQAEHAQEGLAQCRLHDPEYIVLDLNLAGESGLNLIEPLLEASPDARILILTGYASIPTAVSALKLGACQYLPKPANVSDIIQALTDETLHIPALDAEDRMTVQHMEWEYIQRVLLEHDGNITATAKALHMHRRTLQRKLSKKRPQEPLNGP